MTRIMTDQFPIQRISPLALSIFATTLWNSCQQVRGDVSLRIYTKFAGGITTLHQATQKNTRTPPRSKDLHVLVEHCETNGKPIPDWHTDLIHIPKTMREKKHKQTHLRHTSLHHNKCATAQGCGASTPAKLLSLALILRGFFGLVRQAVTNK